LESQKERNHYEDIDMGRRIVQEDGESMEFIHVAQDRNQWRALVDTAVNLLVP
jgi:hypothetical protein